MRSQGFPGLEGKKMPKILKDFAGNKIPKFPRISQDCREWNLKDSLGLKGRKSPNSQWFLGIAGNDFQGKSSTSLLFSSSYSRRNPWERDGNQTLAFPFPPEKNQTEFSLIFPALFSHIFLTFFLPFFLPHLSYFFPHFPHISPSFFLLFPTFFPTFFPHFPTLFSSFSEGSGLTWPRCISPGRRRRALGCKTLQPADSGNWGKIKPWTPQNPTQIPRNPTPNPTSKQNVPFIAHPQLFPWDSFPHLLKILLQMHHSHPGILRFVGILTSLGSCGQGLSFPINCRAGKWKKKSVFQGKINTRTAKFHPKHPQFIPILGVLGWFWSQKSTFIPNSLQFHRISWIIIVFPQKTGGSDNEFDIGFD